MKHQDKTPNSTPLQSSGQTHASTLITLQAIIYFMLYSFLYFLLLLLRIMCWNCRAIIVNISLEILKFQVTAYLFLFLLLFGFKGNSVLNCTDPPWFQRLMHWPCLNLRVILFSKTLTIFGFKGNSNRIALFYSDSSTIVLIVDHLEWAQWAFHISLSIMRIIRR